MGSTVQAHQAGTADLVEQIIVILHGVDPLVQVILEGLGDGDTGGGIVGSLLGFGSEIFLIPAMAAIALILILRQRRGKEADHE